MANKISAQEKREQKKQMKEHNAAIAKMNKNLVPVSKNCPMEMDIQFVDPSSGVFKKGNDKWLEIFDLTGIDFLSPEKKKEMFDALLPDLTVRVRFTTFFEPTTFGEGTRHDYFTLIADGTLYLDVKDELDKNKDIALRVFTQYSVNITQMGINEIMQTIQKHFNLDATFNYASSVKNKNNWLKQCFAELSDKNNSFLLGDRFGSCYFGVQFPDTYSGDILSRFKQMGCPLGFALDINPLSAQTVSDFNRAMENKYNRKLELSARRNIINCSFLVSFSTDSEDARKIVEQTLLSIFSNLGFVLSPSISNEVTTFYSVMSMGLIDTHAMRNISMDVVSSLIL